MMALILLSPPLDPKLFQEFTPKKYREVGEATDATISPTRRRLLEVLLLVA
jgi:hypothetical protein